MRLRCTKCGISKLARRPRSQSLHRLVLFRDYLVHYDTKERIGKQHKIGSRSTTYRRIERFLALTPCPLLLAPNEASAHQAIMVDGFYLAYPSIKAHRHLPGATSNESVLLLAIDARTYQPLHWAVYHRIEDATAWKLFFAELVKGGFSPLYLVHDGHQGIQKASHVFMPAAIHQRCLVHMVRNVHKDVGITPKAPLAKQLQSLIYQLVQVKSRDDKAKWESALQDYLQAYGRAQLAGIPCTKAFLGLHTVLVNAYRRHELFTFLEHPNVPSSTNAIESQNRVLRETLRRHRGMKLPRREALVAWRLLFRSTDDLTVIRAHISDGDRHTF